MADPFSFAASVVGVAVAALQTSKKLHSFVQDFREAPGQLKMLAEQIERDATFLKCAVELICDHEALFRDELVGLVRDIHGQFANIHELIKKLSPRSRSRKRDRFKKLVTVLWNSEKIENIIVQLEALRTTLALILGIAQYAEQRASRKVTASEVDLFKARTSQAIDDCLRSCLTLHNQRYHPLPDEHRRLLAFDESPEDMAVWMAVNLSAPSIPAPAKQLMGPEESGSSLGIARSHAKRDLPFGHIPRAKPEYDKSEVVFHEETLDIKTLQTFGLPYKEERSPDGSHRLTVKANHALQPHEVDMIVGIDVMTKSALKDLPINQAPFLNMSKDVTLCRLLTEWTTLHPDQIQETAGVSCHEDADLDSDSDGGASTAPGSFDRQWEPAKERSTRQPLKYEAERGRTWDADLRSTAERSGKSTRRVPHAGPHWNGYKGNSSNPFEASSRHVQASRRIGQQPAAALAPPGYVEEQQPVTQRHGSFSRRDPARRPVLPPAPPALHPQAPADPHTLFENWVDFTEKTVNASGEIHRSCSPSKPSVPINHNNTERMPVGNSNGTKRASDNGEEKACPLDEIHRGPATGKVPTDWWADPQTHRTAKEDKDLNHTRSLAEIEAKISQPEAAFQHSRDSMQRLSETDKASTGICDENVTTPTRKDDEVEFCEWGIGAAHQDIIPRENDDLEAWRSDLKAKIREEVDMGFRRQQDLQETYNQTFEKRYADLKRHEAEERQLIDRIKEQAKAEFEREREATEERAQEERRLRERLRRITEAENEHVEAQQRACPSHNSTDDFIQQSRSLSEDSLPGPNEESLTQDAQAVQRYRTPRVEYDIMSFLTDTTETKSMISSSSNADSNPGDGSDGTETVKFKTTVRNKEQGNMARNSDVERSRPWKGPAHLGSFIELTPFYLRGSDAGQTWYHGAEPIYIIEFQAGYDGDSAANSDPAADSQSHQRPYLLVSQLWVDPEALDRFGFKYTEGSPSHFFLDPTLSWESIEVLVNFTYALREVETFRTRGQACTAASKLFCGSPPPKEFFETSDDREALDPTSGGQSNEWNARELEEDAEEKPWSLTKRLTHALSVLNVAIHTIT